MPNHRISYNDETLELACVIKTICDTYGIDQEELEIIPAADGIIALTEKVRFRKRIPYYLPLPIQLMPKTGVPGLRIFKQRSIENNHVWDKSTMHKLELGLGEFELQAERPIQFWAWNGSQDYYVLGGHSLYFIQKKDFYHFVKTLKTWEKEFQHESIDPPILPTEMLVDIYNNSIGFLLKGKEMRVRYKKYRIPYKRGILLCGRPGCVTGDTKIRIRKGEITEIQISDFFDLIEQKGGVYEVETPQGWIEIGDMRREQKDCYLLRTANGLSLGAGNDHLVESQNGWEKVEDLDVQNTVIHTQNGNDLLVAKEYLGVRNTFDFEVLSDEHKYYANGIISHNCGKTLTCKWLRQLCLKSGLTYRIITMEEYREALNHGRVRNLFRVPRRQAGVVFFDDMDMMVQNRKESVNTSELSTFLSELDGIEPTEAVIYVFTTNYMAELDEAFVRPGRIDLWLPFHAPTDKLRRKFIEQKFEKEILEIAEVDDLINRTKEYTFAEMEEVRKLFCMDLIDEKDLDVERTFKIFDKHRKDFVQRAEIKGFGSLDDDNNNEPYADVESFVAPWCHYM
ncbi:MAG: AAA family ATPase [Promethearchaeota archaeon]|jgi:hypothetical protein